ncbi:hypothetical protein [Agromyces arachidis]
MIDRTAVPYLAGFALCAGSVLALAACTQGEADARPEAADHAIVWVQAD